MKLVGRLVCLLHMTLSNGMASVARAAFLPLILTFSEPVMILPVIVGGNRKSAAAVPNASPAFMP